jgi:hypothetical protein
MRVVYFLPLLGALCAAQAPAPAAPTPAPEPPSALVKPALDLVDQTIGAMRFDRWKKGSIRDEASQDSDSIANNLHRSLPPLLDAADAAPTANSKLVPAFQNIDAVYDVLLRVYSAARVVGQPEDVDSLQKALTILSQSRRTLAARMQDQAATQEKQLIDLHASYQALKNAPPPKPEPCAPAKPKSRVKTKPAAHKPAAAPNTAQKPPK